MRLRAAPAAKDKKRHSLRRRVLRYVTAGDVVRTKVEFVGLVGEVMAVIEKVSHQNHEKLV
jgi:hypothetical protein